VTMIAATSEEAEEAYHEAGHAVVAYYFRGRLLGEGVRIGDEDAFAHTRSRPWRSVVVSLAGPVAEAKYLGVTSIIDFDEVAAAVERQHDWLGRGRDEVSDELNAVRWLLQAEPDITASDAVERVRCCEAEVARLLDDPRVWSAVERVADALLRHRQLGHAKVMALLAGTGVLRRGCAAG
jgi:hypothetical protein